MNAKTITSALIAAIAGFTLALPGIALADRDDRGHRQAQSQHDGHKSRQRTREFRQERRHARKDAKQDRRHSRRDAHSGHRERGLHKFNKPEHRRHSGHRDVPTYRSKHRDHDRHASKHYKHHKRDRKHHYKHDKRHYGRHYGHKYGHGGYGASYYRDDDDDEKLLIGLVVGGILGYALNESTHDGVDDYDAYYDDSVYRGSSSTVNTSGHGTCLQEREYQTTVVVGGREVDAYGTACLQPDGSWKRSPPQVAAY